MRWTEHDVHCSWFKILDTSRLQGLSFSKETLPPLPVKTGYIVRDRCGLETAVIKLLQKQQGFLCFEKAESHQVFPGNCLTSWLIALFRHYLEGFIHPRCGRIFSININFFEGKTFETPDLQHAPRSGVSQPGCWNYAIFKWNWNWNISSDNLKKPWTFFVIPSKYHSNKEDLLLDGFTFSQEVVPPAKIPHVQRSPRSIRCSTSRIWWEKELGFPRWYMLGMLCVGTSTPAAGNAPKMLGVYSSIWYLCCPKSKKFLFRFQVRSHKNSGGQMLNCE